MPITNFLIFNHFMQGKPRGFREGYIFIIRILLLANKICFIRYENNSSLNIIKGAQLFFCCTTINIRRALFRMNHGFFKYNNVDLISKWLGS